jgi:hypothetical protein
LHVALDFSQTKGGPQYTLATPAALGQQASPSPPHATHFIVALSHFANGAVQPTLPSQQGEPIEPQ